MATEYVPGSASERLVIELQALTEMDCVACQQWFSQESLNVEWQSQGAGFQLLILSSDIADQDRLLILLSDFLAKYVQVELVETRMASSARHDFGSGIFSFANHGEPTSSKIILTSGYAFGTGTHPSTQLVIEAMAERAPLVGNVLDVGCGSAILALVAARLGAHAVHGLDICPNAVLEATENVKKNDLQEVVRISSQPLAEITTTFDFILANLTSSVLHVLAPAIGERAHASSLLFISGLQGRQGDEAVDMLNKYGWNFVDGWSEGKWQARLLGMTGRG